MVRQLQNLIRGHAIDRRQFLSWSRFILGLGWFSIVESKWVFASMNVGTQRETVVHFQIQTTEDEAELEKKEAAASQEYQITSIEPIRSDLDSPLEEVRFVNPVTVVAIATLAVIAIRLVNHWLKNDERGVEIDMRTEPTTISQLHNVPAGTIVTIHKNGEISIHRERYDKPEDVLPTLTAVFGASRQIKEHP